ILAPEIAQDHSGDARRRPRIRHPRGDQPAIGKAGLQGRAVLAVDEDDPVPVAGQLVRRRDADDAGAEDDGGQRDRLAGALPAGLPFVARLAATWACGRRAARAGLPTWA